jgi:methylenetetrahydrofolate reductase (NADPH)
VSLGPSGGKDLRVSFEFFPPKTEKIEHAFWEALEELVLLSPHFVSVTYGAGGTTRARTHEIVTEIQKRGRVKPAAHLTCVGATREEIDDIARDYWTAGVRHIVALRGDPPAGTGKYEPTSGGYAYSSDLVAGLKKIAPFEVSVAGYPEKHPDAASMDADIVALKKKADAGADRVITQFFFETSDFLIFRDRAVKAGVKVPVVPGILPIANFTRAANFAGRCGARVPQWVTDLFKGLEPDAPAHRRAAVDMAFKQCDALRREGVRDFHFYTMNRADLTREVCGMMGLKVKEQLLA